jgi:hypothetical protein
VPEVFVAAPKGSEWSLTLSDAPNPRLAAVRDPASSDRMAALERNMLRRQLGEAARA